MSRIRANNIVNGAGTGAPTFPNGAVISGIATINADIDSNSNITVNQITSLQSLGVGTGATVTNPADNELAFNTNGTERVRVDSSGNVGIGTEEPTKALHISQNSDVAIRLQARNANVDNTSWEIVVGGNPSNDAEMVFRTRNDAGTGGSEIARFTTGGDLKFPSGGGIDFSATTDGSGTTTSELFDDYEEGTWTPILLGSTSESGQTYSGQQGQYTKVGNLVHLRYKVNLSAAGTFTGPYCLIGGFPFNIQGSNAGGVNTVGDGIVYHVGLNSNVYLLALQHYENDNKAYFWMKNSLGASRQYYSGSQLFANTTEISGTVTYHTTS